jgi:ATP phosphoribosyltransferase regulatory subunit
VSSNDLKIITPVERWMLPDGIEEILPPEAHQIEQLRRRLLDLFSRWGYQLVLPPLIEFTDSLLVGLGKDIDLLTFKVTDQLSGRSMGIRADMTPQIARIDAHSLNRSGVNRLCYAGHVLKTQMASALETRSPLQVGVELFGESGLAADVEIISLLLDVMAHAELNDICLDLGHVGIFRALAQAAKLTPEDEQIFFDLLQAKALTEINQWVEESISDTQIAAWLLALPRLTGSKQVLDQARDTFRGAPAQVFEALDELTVLSDVIQNRFPDVHQYFDLGELTGYHYSTGIVFATFAPGMGVAIARGGRYDHIGEVFGRARSATGFTADLVALHRLGAFSESNLTGIFAPISEDHEQWLAIQTLRAQGERVVVGMLGQSTPADDQSCDRILIEHNGQYQVRFL